MSACPRPSSFQRACLASGLVLALLRAAAAASVPAGAAPAELGPRCSGQAATPAHLTLQLGRSTLMRLSEAAMQRSVGNPAVVQSMLLAPDTLYLLGVDIGTTNMIIQGKSGVCSVVDIVVGMDPSGLQAALAAMMPDEKDIHVAAAADALVLSGAVSDAAAVARAVELAGAFVRRPLQALAHGSGDKGSAGVPGAQAGAAPAGGANVRVINLLAVSAPQQVMLEVKIAEVSKSLLDQLDVGASLRYASGSWVTTLLSNFLSGNAHGLLDAKKSNGNQFTVAAQKQDGLVRILAEPTVMAISGQEGSFLAGGTIFIPVAQGNGSIGLEPKDFGVGLRFTPTVLAGGRINLRVAPEVSEVAANGVGVSVSGASSATLPIITTRRASTTVQLFDGQSFAIGGLIKNNLVTNLKGLPVLGELPVLGALFRSTDFQEDRTELLFVVTAHLVKPLPPNYALPTDKVSAPTRTELFLHGQLQGRSDTPPPVSVSAPDGAGRAAAQVSGFELK